MLLQGVCAEKQALATELQHAQPGNHKLTGQLSSMATELNTAKHAQLESGSQLQVQALLTGLACFGPLLSCCKLSLTCGAQQLLPSFL